MPASKVVNMGKVLTNGTTFISLHFRSEKNDLNNEVVDKFYWLLSNSSGVPTSERNNALNGYFSSQAAAEAGPPDGYTGLPPVDNYNSTKEIGFLDMFPWDADNVFRKFDDAILSGATYIVVPIWWDRIFSSLTEQDANDSSKWSQIDSYVNYIATKTNITGSPMKISLRIFVGKDDSLHNDIEGSYNPIGNFYGLSQSAMDEYGKPVREITDTGGMGHVSFAYTTGRNQVLSFIEKVLLRYKLILGSKFFEYSVVWSPQQECGNTYDNQIFYTELVWSEEEMAFVEVTRISRRYPIDLDHSTYSVEAFRTWLASPAKYNGNIEALKSAWGSNDASFSVIQSPKTGVPYTTVSRENVNSKFSNRKGLDWWYWNNKLVTTFLTDCRQLGITNAVGAKFVAEYASLFDDLAPSRSSCDIKNIRNYADKVKAQLGALPSFGDKYRELSFSLDVFRENVGNMKFGTELNHNDFVEGYEKTTDPTLIERMMTEMGQSCIKTGANDLLFISNGNHTPYFNAVLRSMVSLRSFMFTNTYKDAPTITVNYSLEQFLINRNQVISNFISAGGGASTRIKAVQVDVSGDVNVTGMYRLNGSIGADHAFLKSNGTTQEWSLLTVGEISDIDTLYASKVYTDLNYIKRVTDEGERGFYLYGDTANTVKEAFLFTNPDTGIVGIHAYRLNGSIIEQYGYQLTKDGLPYWLFADGTRKRILTENDAVGGGGGTVGGTVTSDLNFGVQRNIFWRNPGITDPNNFAAKLFWQGSGSYSSSIFTEGSSGMVFEAATNMNIGTTQDLKLKGQKIFWNGIEIDMSTFAINRYLRATSSTKAEWVV